LRKLKSKVEVQPNHWGTIGTLDVMPEISWMAERLERDVRVLQHGPRSEAREGQWWNYDALWTTEDGATIRGRFGALHQLAEPRSTTRRRTP
jgi:hypothetical protein